MSRQKTTMIAAAGVSIIGAGVYTMRGRKDPPQRSPNKARDKRDLGLSGAGIANTGAAGGNERAIDPSKDRKIRSTARKEDLPAGGIGRGKGV